MHTRKAILPDASQIHDLILHYSQEGTLLPRTMSELCENVRDFLRQIAAPESFPCARRAHPRLGAHETCALRLKGDHRRFPSHG